MLSARLERVFCDVKFCLPNVDLEKNNTEERQALLAPGPAEVKLWQTGESCDPIHKDVGKESTFN